MNIKKLSLFIFILLIIGIGISFGAMAKSEFVDTEIPDSWYETPKTASQVGIDQFNQAPMLEKQVTEGDLPSVEKRLPQDPPVIEPYEKTGKYGGTINVFDTNLNGMELNYWLDGSLSATHATPDGNDVIPWFIKDWEYSNDYKNFTIYLREGIKWSNGQPLTAEDYLYWWKYYANNEELSPAPPEEWNPPLLDVTSEDKLTVTFHYEIQNSAKHTANDTANSMAIWELGPHEYMKQFHPDFIGEEKANKMAEEAGLDYWADYYDRIQEDSVVHPEYEHQRPVLNAYKVVDRTETTLIAERNPYFPFIDNQGNQLPYIDKIRVNLANNKEMAKTKAATGEVDFGARHTDPTDMPLYHRNSEKENYKVLQYTMPRGPEPTFIPNLTHKDPQIKAIFQDVRFRKALSLALDRDSMNNKIIYGNAVPMRATASLTNEPPFKQKYAEAEYNPEKAKELLDEMGMIDKNGDGFREMPTGILKTFDGTEVELDGETFNPTLMMVEYFYIPAVSEMAIQDWQDIGLDITLKEVSRELRDTRWDANEGEIETGATAGVAGYIKRSETFGRNFAPIVPFENPWPAYSTWYQTNGEKGEEPPEQFKKLYENLQTLIYSPDEQKRYEAEKALYESMHKNYWRIGTLGMTPVPIIVNEKLQNIPEKGLWEWNFGVYSGIMHLEQVYLSE